MPRAPRRQHWAAEACYHVLNRGHNREGEIGDALRNALTAFRFGR